MHKNKKMQTSEIKQRFGFRKMSIGLCSAVLGSMVFALNTNHPVVHAATTDNSDANNSQVVNSDKAVAEASQSNAQSADQAQPQAQTNSAAQASADSAKQAQADQAQAQAQAQASNSSENKAQASNESQSSVKSAIEKQADNASAQVETKGSLNPAQKTPERQSASSVNQDANKAVQAQAPTQNKTQVPAQKSMTQGSTIKSPAQKTPAISGAVSNATQTPNIADNSVNQAANHANTSVEKSNQASSNKNTDFNLTDNLSKLTADSIKDNKSFAQILRENKASIDTAKLTGMYLNSLVAATPNAAGDDQSRNSADHKPDKDIQDDAGGYVDGNQDKDWVSGDVISHVITRHVDPVTHKEHVEAVTHVVHHNAETKQVDVPAQTHIVHHDATYTTITVPGQRTWVPPEFEYSQSGSSSGDANQDIVITKPGYWEEGPSTTETVESSPAYDETVVDVPAHKETQVVKKAWDETVTDIPAHDRTVIDQDGYTETVTTWEARQRRTILVHNPDGTTTDASQYANIIKTDISRTDDSTKKTTTNLGQWTTSNFGEYVAPKISGYTATIPTVSAESTDPQYSDPEINIYYIADARSVNFKFVDDNNNEAQVGATVTRNGRPGDTASDLGLVVPDKYELAPGQDLPTSYTFKDTNPDQIIHLVHALVPSTDPSLTQKKVTRTVIFNTPSSYGDKPQNVVQTANFKRTVYLDAVTGKIAHVNNDGVSDPNGHEAIGDWHATSDNDAEDQNTPTVHLDSVPVVQVNGYTPNPSAVNAWDVKGTDQDQTITVNYNANAQAERFIFEDKDNNNQQVGSPTTINGVTNQTAQVSLKVPDNYELADGETLPTSYTFKTTNPDTIIYLKHKHAQAPDVSKTVNRTVEIYFPDGKESDSKQTVTFKRDGYIDLVTKQPHYTNWSENGQHVFDAISVPPVSGYTPSTTVDRITVTPNDGDLDVKVHYTANPQSININYQTPDGKVLTQDSKSGTTGENVKLTYDKTPKGYQIVPGQQLPDNYTFLPKDNHDIPVIVDVKKDNLPDEKETETRIVTITTPDGKSTDTTQSVTFTRTAVKNEVTGATENGPWSENGTHHFDEVPAKAIEGYAINGSAPAIDVHPGYGTKHIYITYVADGVTNTWHYVDDDESGKTVGTDHQFAGKVNDTTSFDATKTQPIPAGYDLVTPGSTNVTYTFKPQGQNTPVIIHLKHHITDLTGLNAHTVKRTIRVTNPQDKTTDTLEQITFSQSGKRDEVTGKITYGKWTNDDTQTFKAWHVPDYQGYKPAGDIENDPNGGMQVGADTVHHDSKDILKVVTYNPDDETQKIIYVDPDKNPVVNDSVGGKFNSTTGLTYDKVPDGWVMVPDQKLPSSVTFKTDNPDIIVNIEHGKIKVPHDNPHKKGDPIPGTKTRHFDDGSAKDDLNHASHRVITVIEPSGKRDVTTQTVNFTRDSLVDTVTGKVISYTDWTPSGDGNYAEFDSPKFDGYKPSVEKVPVEKAVVTKDADPVTITYTAEARNTVLRFLDQDSNNAQVGPDHPFNGNVGQTIDITGITVPEHYVLAPGQSIPTSYSFKDKDNQPMLVYLKHKIDILNPTNDKDNTEKTVTRTVEITDPQGKESDTKQQVTFTRTGTYDEVTGKRQYNPWSENGQHVFDSVPVPDIPGYTPSAQVPQITVTPQSPDEDLRVHYTSQPQNTNVDYKTPDGKIIKQDNIGGKTDQTVDVPYEVPDHYQIVPGQDLPKTYTFKNKDNPDIIVNVEPIKTPQADDTQSVTRVVTITTPDGKSTDTTQTVTFTRHANKNEVTGEIEYGDWSENGKHTFDEVTAKPIAGYAINGSAPEIVVTPNDKDSHVYITYVANGQSSDWHFVDDDNNGSVVGGKHLIAGKTNQTIGLDIQSQIPGNYELVGGQNIPATYTFKDKDNDPVVVHLKHKTQLIDDDTTKATVSRTIKVTNPDGHVNSAIQQVTFKRDGIKDLVTGKVTYGQWSNGDSQTMSAWPVPEIQGYKASGTVDPVTVHHDTPAMEVDITYTPLNSNQKINYVDPNHTPIKSDTISGQIGTTVEPKYDIPDGWVVVTPGPKDVTFKETNPDITVVIKHGEILVPGDKPVKPGDQIPGTQDKHFKDGSTQDDLNHTSKRKIIVVNPDGTKNVTDQKVAFTRDSLVDTVTGEVIKYSDWRVADNSKGEYPSFKAPKIDGYNANPDYVFSEKADPTKDAPDVVISYDKLAKPEDNKPSEPSQPGVVPYVPQTPETPQQPQQPQEPQQPAQPTEPTEPTQKPTKKAPKKVKKAPAKKVPTKKVDNGPVRTTPVVPTPAVITTPSNTPSAPVQEPQVTQVARQAAPAVVQSNGQLPQTGSSEEDNALALAGLAVIGISMMAFVPRKRED